MTTRVRTIGVALICVLGSVMIPIVYGKEPRKDMWQRTTQRLSQRPNDWLTQYEINLGEDETPMQFMPMQFTPMQFIPEQDPQLVWYVDFYDDLQSIIDFLNSGANLVDDYALLEVMLEYDMRLENKLKKLHVGRLSNGEPVLGHYDLARMFRAPRVWSRLAPASTVLQKAEVIAAYFRALRQNPDYARVTLGTLHTQIRVVLMNTMYRDVIDKPSTFWRLIYDIHPQLHYNWEYKQASFHLPSSSPFFRHLSRYFSNYGTEKFLEMTTALWQCHTLSREVRTFAQNSLRSAMVDAVGGNIQNAIPRYSLF